MSRRLPTAALLAALVLPCLAGCGAAPTTGKGGAATHPSSATNKSAESGKDSAKTATHHHDPR